jgi:D-beta-D-heptose 7-phosphate kinase/D-beta-D-heptose 1-phosphate adenosyltransferase
MTINLPTFVQGRVLVVGDVMLDRYWVGNAARISPEAPVPVVHIQKTKESAGGAGNVALNITALDAKASLMGIIGDDEAGRLLEALLKEKKVSPLLSVVKTASTIIKLRILSQHQQLIRLDFEEPFNDNLRQELNALYSKEIVEHDVIILSDYSKGALNNVSELIAQARAKNKPVFIDPKGNDFTKYKGATLLTPNLKEFEIIVGACANEKEIEIKGSALIEKLDLQALLVTRSEKGMSLLQRNKAALHIPTEAQDVFDVTGAGDTVIGVLAAAVAAGQSLEQAVLIANVAAGLVVAKSGSATVSMAELNRAVQAKKTQHSSEIIDEDSLLAVRQQVKQASQTVVMTNGCFDLLHAGHIAYLEEAKALGDYLIVAVNDDASVRGLKGPTRPIVPLAERMAVLAGLKSVDYVVSFSEDTPARLIEKLLPDILVKGADYTVDQVAGSKAVLNAGGQVKMLKFKDGCSTSKIVEKIKNQK